MVVLFVSLLFILALVTASPFLVIFAILGFLLIIIKHKGDKMKKILGILILVLMISGCAGVQYKRLGETEQPKLNSNGSAYVLVPVNAMYFTKECLGSGQAIGSLIYSAFSNHLKRVEMAPEGEKLADGLKKAKDSGFTYLVDSKIARWEDRVTEWNGIEDQIDMQMDILDVQSDKLIDSVEFQGHGTWVTFGGYHPQNIVRYQIPEYVDQLFPATTSKERK
jgi:hypothetical protein